MIHFVKELAAGPPSSFLAWWGNDRVALFAFLADIALAWHVDDWTGALCLNTDMAEAVSGWSTGSLGFPQWCQSCDVSHGHLRLWGTAMKWKLLKICEKYFQGIAVFPLTYGFITPMINSWDTHLLRLAMFSPKCLLITMPVLPKIQWDGSSFQMSSTTEFLIWLI